MGANLPEEDNPLSAIGPLERFRGYRWPRNTHNYFNAPAVSPDTI